MFFILVCFTRKNCKNEAKISNFANIRYNVIQNLEVDFAIIWQINNKLIELKINIRSTVFNLHLKEWSEIKNSFFCSLCCLYLQIKRKPDTHLVFIFTYSHCFHLQLILRLDYLWEIIQELMNVQQYSVHMLPQGRFSKVNG